MLTKIFPFLLWLKGYGKEKFKLDFLSGLTVALVLIPQSMAYAQLAGLPPYYGLYAAFLPPMVAALFGSSRQLQTGPVAVVSLMTAASLGPLATAGSDQYIAYAVLLALTVGIFQFMLGVLRLGLIVNFLSHPVVNGFTNAAAIIIGLSQLSKLFGVYVDAEPHFFETIMKVIDATFHYIHWPTLGMGVLAIVIMAGLKKINPKIPNVLVAVVITTLISYFAGFHNDKKISMGSIKDQVVQKEIKKFNKTVKAIEELGKQRTKINSKYEEMVKTFGVKSLEALKFSNELQVINTLIASTEEDQKQLRAKLRQYKFALVKSEGEDSFIIGSAPAQAAVSDDVWRLKISNKVLDTEKLTLMGGGAVVGSVPAGLPKISIPKFSFKMFFKLLPFAVIISLLGFMEAIAIAKAMAAKTGQKLDPNQELIGQGLSNMLGSFGQSYPVSGSFSRSAVNFDAGAVTGISSVVTSLLVVVALLFFTPLLYHLPQAVLAAVIMMAVFNLINFEGIKHAWKAKKYDGIIAVITFFTTLAFAPHLDKGIEIGVILSIGVFLYNCMRPTVVTLAMHDDMSLRDADLYGLSECPHVAVIRFDGTLFFANATYLEEKVLLFQKQRPELQHIIIVCEGINDIDASGEEALDLLIDRVRASGVDISLAEVKEKVMRVLKRTHLYHKIGEEHIYGDIHDAIETIFYDTHHSESVYTCPLVAYVPDENKEPVIQSVKRQKEVETV